MEKVFCDHDRFRVFQVKQLLEEKGIPCFVKNEYAIGAMGELSPMDVLPEIWLYDDEWQPKAEKIIQAFLANPPSAEPWHCPKCQEKNEANFEICWQCASN